MTAEQLVLETVSRRESSSVPVRESASNRQETTRHMFRSLSDSALRGKKNLAQDGAAGTSAGVVNRSRAKSAQGPRWLRVKYLS